MRFLRLCAPGGRYHRQSFDGRTDPTARAGDPVPTEDRLTPWLPPGVHPALAGKPFFPANRDKRPAVKEWRPFADRLPNEQETASWKNHRGPWAMLCGPLSFVAVDFDGEEGKKLYEEKFGN